jgi:hypothetical protein
MPTKNAGKTAMDGVAGITRNMASALVDREERRTGSRMVAYENVARTVGTTSTWLRIFISTNGANEPRITLGFNIIEVYRRVCERVEQAGDRERQLKEEIDAALESAGLLVAPAKRAESGRAAAADPE